MIAKANQQNQSNPTTLSNETGLNEEALVTLLRNSYELQPQPHEENKITTRALLMDVDSEIRECPMCYWEFPKDMKFVKKTEHIEKHFQ